MERDDIFTTPTGTEISVEAAAGDLGRAVQCLQDEGHDDLAADLQHVTELLEMLAGTPSAEEVFGEPLYSVRVKGDTAEASTYGAAALALHTLAKENGE